MHFSKIKIGVFGGTAFDSSRGAVYLQAKQVPCVSVAMSNNPDAQNALYAEPKKLIARFEELVTEHQLSHVILFCNSLSLAAPWREIYKGTLYELGGYYQTLLPQLKTTKTAVVVAEPGTKQKLEHLIKTKGLNPYGQSHVFAELDLIKQLEVSNENEQRQLISNYFKQKNKQGFTHVVTGCTHLDHPDFWEWKEPKIVQPGLQMLHDFIDYYKTL